MKTTLAFILIWIIFPYHLKCLGQIQPVPQPQFSTFSSLPKQNKTPTSVNLIEQQNKLAMKRMGYIGPNYTPNMTQEQKIQENNRFIREELWKQKGYEHLNPNKGINRTSEKQSQVEYIKSILNEVNKINQHFSHSNYYSSTKFQNDFSNYKKAKNTLKLMLSGKKALSIRDAIYQIEAAYGNLHLSYEQYCESITQSGNFIKQWLKENNYDLDNQEALHLGIQKFMGDTLYIKGEKKIDRGISSFSSGHIPYFYDYVDMSAQEDFRNYFLTKTIATGTGQCHSMPLVYLVLAEEVKAEAYLSFSLHHSFIKYKNTKRTIQNYETTIDWNMTDQQYAEEMPTISEGERNGLYLDTLGKQQIIATFLVDLAYYFQREHWVYDGQFINDCLNTSANYFQRKYGNNPEWYYMKSRILATELDNVLMQYKVTNLNNIPKYPEVQKAFDKFRDHEQIIEKLGIQGMSDTQMIPILEKHDKRGKLQQAKKIKTKSIKNLFF
ncbi:MAG: hypothetical protein ACWA41_04565 [Putridiphycobacter sp.]